MIRYTYLWNLNYLVILQCFNLSLGNGFCDVCRQLGGGGSKNTPGHISSSRSRSDIIPTAAPMFSGSSFLMVVLPISWNVDMRQKSKMATKIPEVPITLVVLQIHMSFQKQYRRVWLRTKHLYVQQSWPTLPRVENPRWRPTNRK